MYLPDWRERGYRLQTYVVGEAHYVDPKERGKGFLEIKIELAVEAVGHFLAKCGISYFTIRSASIRHRDAT